MKMKSSTHKRSAFILTLFILAHDLKTVSSFASWFVERSVSCWTDLAEGEVVMNNDILPVSKSTFPQTTIQVLDDNDNDLVVDNTFIVPATATASANDKDKTFRLAMKYPSDMPLSDLQFVMETSDGATFVDASGRGGYGCDGRRAFGRKNDEIILQINGPIDDKIEVWAGWAMGHEAVTLTPRITFQYLANDNNDNSKKDTEEENPILTLEEQNIIHDIAEDPRLDSEDRMNKLNEDMEDLLAKHKAVAMEKLQHMHDSILKRDDHEKIKHMQMGISGKDAKPLHRDVGKGNPLNDIHDAKIDRMTRFKNEKNVESGTNNSQLFEMTHFYQASIFMILSIVTVLACAKKTKKSQKGRRDL